MALRPLTAVLATSSPGGIGIWEAVARSLDTLSGSFRATRSLGGRAARAPKVTLSRTLRSIGTSRSMDQSGKCGQDRARLASVKYRHIRGMTAIKKDAWGYRARVVLSESRPAAEAKLHFASSARSIHELPRR